ncbi:MULTISPECIES: FtsX-like permease family protein [unclassified Oceanispirochaeta]|uniref:ABC transporter permease n=1 Tax=unclassified Oceanispirochaeta TaxID=2635722 RepID=UPI000E08CEB3|nr:MULTISPECIES: FtsX-like permease family protein [unclassified Oceanispirochaeta]MBF9014409.1 ABC transporter permease [Oceanispirochaeta sp. M2]NPD71295.1 ABC transporter permease [Oceanispirochaeta sp. M1]RDG33676.1 ABC transporter permease [Oceanispirochaeta sp. M1]
MAAHHTLTLSISYFKKHLNRYIFLLISLSIGFAVITIMSSLSMGMTDTLHNSARGHYGGDLFIISYDKDHGNKMHMSEPELVKDLLENTGLEYDLLQKRINYYREGILYFNGEGVGQKNVYGVEWEDEDFSALDIVEGSTDDLILDQSIMISETVASELGCKIGDSIILQGNTLSGQKNTVSLVLRAVFRDTSIFGYYKSYVPLKELASLLRFSEGDISSYGIYKQEGSFSSEDIKRVHTALSDNLDTAPLLENKEDLTRQLDRTQWTGERYFIIPLSLYISQVDDLLTAIDLVSYFLYIMVALIILVSVAVSYQMVIRERLSEIGTLRAIGMNRTTIMTILVLEALWLFGLSLLMGALLSIPGFGILSLIDYSALPGFELFLQKGRLVPLFTIKSVVLNILLLGLILIPAAVIPSYRASRYPLIEALT